MIYRCSVDLDGYSEQDLAGKKVKLTLMEEVLLLGLKDEQVKYLHFLYSKKYLRV
jgi:hypothetical protein